MYIYICTFVYNLQLTKCNQSHPLHILGTMEWQEAREAVPAIDFVQQQMKAAWPWYLVCCIKYY